MTPLQRNLVYPLHTPILPGFLLGIDVGWNIAVRRFMYSEGYMPRRGIHKRDDLVWVVGVTEKDELPQASENGSSSLIVFALDVPGHGGFANDVA